MCPPWCSWISTPRWSPRGLISVLLFCQKNIHMIVFLNLEGPTRKPRHASVFSTHLLKRGPKTFRHASVFKTRVFAHLSFWRAKAKSLLEEFPTVCPNLILNVFDHWETAMGVLRKRCSPRDRKGSFLSVALPAEPRGEKNFFFVQILGGEKLLKFGEKWAVKIF